MTAGTIDDQIRETKNEILFHLNAAETSTDEDQRYRSLHTLNSTLIVCNSLLSTNGDSHVYDDLKKRFIKILLYTTPVDSAIERARAEYFSHVKRTFYGYDYGK
jgi:hypothetical protein